ncbi:hypothetical protein TcCL_NonESM05692 [Trypanosoma cruzi]|nr:hypothetical protein TcCL_NonESM05692 [Trypanosoma cruzi]
MPSAALRCFPLTANHYVIGWWRSPCTYSLPRHIGKRLLFCGTESCEAPADRGRVVQPNAHMLVGQNGELFLRCYDSSRGALPFETSFCVLVPNVHIEDMRAEGFSREPACVTVWILVAELQTI